LTPRGYGYKLTKKSKKRKPVVPPMPLETRTETRDGKQFVVKVLKEAKPKKNRKQNSRFHFIDVGKAGGDA
jgi:hypothetical protein